MKTIKVKIKSVYGNETIYPMCETAKIFSDMIGTKTLTRAAITKIKKLGYTVEVVQESSTL